MQVRQWLAVGVAAALLAVASPASASNLFEAPASGQGKAFPFHVVVKPLACIALVPAALCFAIIIVGPVATHVIYGWEILGRL